MNYNSVDEILSSGTTNMEVIRNNSKQDDGTDSITGVNWFTYNGTVASTIYVSGDSWIGFGSSSERLNVNRRDNAMYSLYREEGTLYGHYKFLKIRWVGYSHYNLIATNYKIEYDVILWDTGDISLHMISIPTSYNSGTYSLVASSTYTYTVSTSSPDVTFVKTDSGFEVSNDIIDLQLPYEKRFLIKSGSTYYTIVNNALSNISVSDLTSSTFLDNGIDYIPDYSLIKSLPDPQILFWADKSDLVLEDGLVVYGTPPIPHIVYYESQDIPSGRNIRQAEMLASDDVLLAITFDNGQNYKYYNGSTWITDSTNSEGMSPQMLKNVPTSAWSEVASSSTFSFRCILPTIESTTGKIYIRYV